MDSKRIKIKILKNLNKLNKNNRMLKNKFKKQYKKLMNKQRKKIDLYI